MKIIFTFLLLTSLSWASTISEIKKRGHLNCGVSEGLTGFSIPNEKGEWKGFDVDICKAIAVAIFNDTQKVKFIPTSLGERFNFLAKKQIDILSRNTSRTFSREVTRDVEFAPVVYFDTQGILVSKRSKIKKIKDLDNKKICVKNNTTTQQNLIDYFKHHNLRLRQVRFDNNDQLVLGFLKKRCIALTSDVTTLISEKNHFQNSKSFTLLSERIEKEPLAPVILSGDRRWKNLVDWTIYSLIWAEELGVSSTNIEAMKTSADPRVKRFFGEGFNFEKMLGVSNGWTGNIISKIGNYSEVFHRNLGRDSNLKIPRGLNSLWKDGGILYSPPMK
ncbi:amino acid ABC transporter substrate-binding protein [Halobacteriovorax marinus]|uniref:amino acid ABC transporter substrate-binding protein n=1 Tax=Halobacteriovorax marinus TaxID=97084 RepID=UPI003A8DE91E